MTAVVIWYEPDDERQWVCADSRIVRQGEIGLVRLTDGGAKLFALPMVCRVPPNGPDLDAPLPHFAITYGFAFAGASLPALMAHATASQVLSDLLSVPDRANPDIDLAVHVVRRLAARFIGEVASSTSFDQAVFECAVFGYSHVRSEFEAHHIVPERIDERGIVEVTSTRRGQNETVVFGSGAGRVREQLRQMLDAPPGPAGIRVPRRALQKVIEEDRGDVGGALSAAFVTKSAFHITWTIKPIAEADGRYFNGVNVDKDVGDSPPFFVGGMGTL